MEAEEDEAGKRGREDRGREKDAVKGIIRIRGDGLMRDRTATAEDKC